MYHPLHFCVCHRLTEVVARVDSGLNGLALQHSRGLRHHFYCILRLLVVLHRKAHALDVALARLHVQVVETEIGVWGNRVIPMRGPHVGKVHRLLPDGFVCARVTQFECQFAILRNNVSGRRFVANDSLEVHGVTGAIHGTIRVGIAA